MLINYHRLVFIYVLIVKRDNRLEVANHGYLIFPTVTDSHIFQSQIDLSTRIIDSDC